MNRNQPDPSFCQIEQPKPQPTRHIVFTTSEEKPMLNTRTLAAAFWASYFVMHWLLILEVVKGSTGTAATTDLVTRCCSRGEKGMTCPKCGSSDLKRGKQNLWCASCGFFPIPYPPKENQDEQLCSVSLSGTTTSIFRGRSKNL